MPVIDVDSHFEPTFVDPGEHPLQRFVEPFPDPAQLALGGTMLEVFARTGDPLPVPA